MRLLALIQGDRPEDQIGYHRGLEDCCRTGRLAAYLPIAWRGPVTKNGWDDFCHQVLAIACDFVPDAVYFQFFHAQGHEAQDRLLAGLRQLPRRPIVALSAGDAFSWVPLSRGRFPDGFVKVARAADVTFLTALGRCADDLVRKGARNILLMPLGGCQERFKPTPLQPGDPEFDVVFVGRNCRARDPRSHLFLYGIKRRFLIRKLQRRYGKRFGLFGGGWEGYPSWQGSLLYDQQLAACRRAHVVFGGAPGSYQDYYTSDRPFIQAVSGVPLVDWAVPRVEALMRPHEHWYLVRNSREMLSEIDRLLDAPTAELRAAAGATADYVHRNLSHRAMMEFLVSVLRELVEARDAGRHAGNPIFPFFLPEVDQIRERNYASRAWVG